MIMKLIFAAILANVAAGFQPVSFTVHRVTALSMASSLAPKPSLNEWNGKSKNSAPEAVRKVSKRERERLPDVMIEPSYFLTQALCLLGPLIWWYHPCKFFRMNTHVFVD